MANGARGEIAFELGGTRYVLRPEFGVIARIEDELGSPFLKLAQRLPGFDVGARELVHTLAVVLSANGYETKESKLAGTIAEEGVVTAMMPLIAYVGSYLWGGRDEKKAESAATARTAETEPEGATPGPSTQSSSANA